MANKVKSWIEKRIISYSIEKRRKVLLKHLTQISKNCRKITKASETNYLPLKVFAIIIKKAKIEENPSDPEFNEIIVPFNKALNSLYYSSKKHSVRELKAVHIETIEAGVKALKRSFR